jgi:hypothetical protein
MQQAVMLAERIPTVPSSLTLTEGQRRCRMYLNFYSPAMEDAAERLMQVSLFFCFVSYRWFKYCSKETLSQIGIGIAAQCI